MLTKETLLVVSLMPEVVPSPLTKDGSFQEMTMTGNNFQEMYSHFFFPQENTWLRNCIPTEKEPG